MIYYWLQPTFRRSYIFLKVLPASSFTDQGGSYLRGRNRSSDPGRQGPLIALGVSGYAFHAAQSIFPSLLRAGLRFSGRTPQTADRKEFQEITNLRNVGCNTFRPRLAEFFKSEV
jgi:hypothetical protein